MITLINKDCLPAIEKMQDNQFDLAIVDPPYDMPKNATNGSGKLKNRILNIGEVEKWDVAPTKKYFKELFRVSKNQIIWGGNYFELPKTRGFVIWDKQQPFPNFSACEFAWLSFQVPSKIFVQATTRTKEKKIHPTQKPVKLYEWLLIKFAKKGNKILDTHLGSGSIAIACHNLGYDLTAFELDRDYFEAATKRLKQHQSQIRMF